MALRDILTRLGTGIQGVSGSLFPVQGIAGPVQDPNAPPDPEQEALQKRAKSIQNNALLTLGLGLLAGKGQGQRFGPAAFQALQAAQGGFGQQIGSLQNEQFRNATLKEKKAEAEARAKIAQATAADRQAGLQIQRDSLNQRTAQQDAMLKQQAELAAQRMALEKAGLGQRGDIATQQMQTQRDIAAAKLAQAGQVQGFKQRTANEAKEEALSGNLQSAALARTALNDASKLLNARSMLPKTGMGGAITRMLPGEGAGTDALKLKDLVDTARANFSIERINNMRAQSKTGGAVGQVTEKEWDRLANTISNLDPNLSGADLKKEIAKAQKHIDELEKLGAFKRIQLNQSALQGGFGQGAQPPAAVQPLEIGQSTQLQGFTIKRVK